MSLTLANPNVDQLNWYKKPLFGEFGRRVWIFLYYLTIPLGYMIFFLVISFFLGIIMGVFKSDPKFPDYFILLLIIPYIFIHIYLRMIYVKRWRAPNIEWAEWLKKSQNTKKIDDTPVIKNNSELNLCLNNWPQKIKRSGQYQFKSSQEASIFCSRHREAVVLQLRMSVGRDSGESRLGIGQLQVEKDHVLLIFRQVTDECCLFFTVRHYQTGLVVNVITQKWFLFYRTDIPNSYICDYEFAVKYSKNENKFRDDSGVIDRFKDLDDDYGLLGVWHWVHHHSFGKNGHVDTSFAESELNYYENIVHVETLQEAMGAYSEGGPSAHSIASNVKGEPAVAQPETWL